MPDLVVKGRLLPPGPAVSLPGFYRIEHRGGVHPGWGSYDIYIQNSELTVNCTICDVGVSRGRVLKDVGEALQIMADVISFPNGRCYRAEIESWTEAGVETVYGIRSEAVAGICTAYGLDCGFDEVMSLVMADNTLCCAFNDLVLSTRGGFRAYANMGRGIEALKSVVSPGVEGDAAWAPLRQALNIEEAYLRTITRAATNGRHGRIHPNDPEHIELQQRCWAIMDRLLHYLKRDREGLPLDEFPMLSLE